MIWFNGSDLISPKANNGLLQPQLQDDDDDDEERRSVPELGSMVLLFLASFHPFLSSSFYFLIYFNSSFPPFLPICIFAARKCPYMAYSGSGWIALCRETNFFSFSDDWWVITDPVFDLSGEAGMLASPSHSHSRAMAMLYSYLSHESTCELKASCLSKVIHCIGQKITCGACLCVCAHGFRVQNGSKTVEFRPNLNLVPYNAG